MTALGLGVASQISGAPVLFDPIVDEDIEVGVLNYDVAWTGDYAAIFIELSEIQSTGDGNAFYMQMSDDGGATFGEAASDYRFRNDTWGTGTTTLAGPLGLIGLSTNTGIGSAANEKGSWSIIIPSPSVSGRKTVLAAGQHTNPSGNMNMNRTFGYRDADQIVNAVRFKTTGGATYVSGHCTASGLRRP